MKRFYKWLLTQQWQSEVATKCKQRFEKNRKKLFTFLSYDGVPWNNNNAEHAMKAFAALRDVIEGTTTPSGIEEYLILLSVSETCRYKNVDFLELRSREKDINAFFSQGHVTRRDGGKTELKGRQITLPTRSFSGIGLYLYLHNLPVITPRQEVP